MPPDKRDTGIFRRDGGAPEYSEDQGWKEEIIASLSGLHTAINTVSSNQNLSNQKMDVVSADVKTLKTIMLGDTEPEKGMIVRFNTLEQKAKASSKLFWVIIGALVPILVVAVIAILAREIHK